MSHYEDRVSFDSYERRCEALGYTPQQATKQLNYSDSTAAYWRERGTVPRVVYLAVTQLPNLNTETEEPQLDLNTEVKPEAEPPHCLLVRPEAHDYTTVVRILEAFEVPYATI